MEKGLNFNSSIEPRKIDVIIPMYNRSDCVQNIIKALSSQTFKDFRAICLDDGSGADTYDVLKNTLPNAEFESLLVRKENGGAASARNTGLHLVTAEWISFVDSDDGLKPEFLEYLYTAATEGNAELSVCGLKMYLENEDRIITPAGELAYCVIDSAEAMKRFCTRWFGPVCLLIKAENTKQNKIFYDENCIYNEDAPYIAEVIASCETVAYIENELYLYFTHAGSLHRSPSVKKFLSVIKSFSKTEEKLLKDNSIAAKTFNNMGAARFYIATLRRAAIQLDYKDFAFLEKEINFKKYKQQIKNLSISQQFASYLLLFSKHIFRLVMKAIFKD